MASMPNSSLHILLFPFMSKGHTIPLLDLARLLLCRKATVTIFTTPSNRTFISSSLSDVTVTIIDLPFPQNIDGIPSGVESTDKLPSMSLYPTFATATKLIQPSFEAAIQNMPPVTFMITDAFLGWTLDSANKFNIPRFVYYGMSNFAGAVSRAVMSSGLLAKAESDDELFQVPDFPWLKLTRNDFEPPFTDREPGGALFNFVMEQIATTAKSRGLIVNSFFELDSANKFNIPRFAYFGTSNFTSAVGLAVVASGSIMKADDELLEVPAFPGLKLTGNDFGSPFTDCEPSGPAFNVVMEQLATTSKSRGLIVNSYNELEPIYLDYYNRECKPKAWSIGPFCLAQPLKAHANTSEKTPWTIWLDEKLEQGIPVLYVAFGSQAEISPEQFEEIKIGLEKSEVNFFWVVRKVENRLNDGYEERIKGRGIVVKEWVDQREILGHKAVTGFLSHCGWNSVLESICAAVPILAWPMMGEQHLNARMVVDELKIGIRVETFDGSVRGFVKWEGLEKTVRELMEARLGRWCRKRRRRPVRPPLKLSKKVGHLGVR